MTTRLHVALHGGTESGGPALARDVVGTARTARDLGYSGVVAGQHFFTAPQGYFQPLPLLSRLIPETGDMRLVAGVLLLPLLNPLQLAEDLATVDALSGGRLVVGAGQGYRDAEFAAFGVRKQDRLGAQLRALDSMAAWWGGAAVEEAGSGLAMQPVSRPHPPIWYAAGNRRAYARAAERGWTPFIGPQATPSVITALLAGEPPARSVALRRDVLVTDVIGAAAAGRALDGRSAAYGAWGYGAADADEQPYLVGTARECREQMAALAAAGVTDLVIRTNWPGVEHAASLEMLAAVAGPVEPAPA
jgi:alkanesulfonate monooxygenase SsuD/methylene tetrahydromethanopterin reductase-like flavin-dependent oxidoreductase (luciferase family)